MQAEVHKTVDAVRQTVLNAVLAGSVGNAQCVSLHDNLYALVWGKLVASEAQGGALATASFLPLWELMQQIASLYISEDGTSAARALFQLMLSSLYGKSKDRRCHYQQLLGCGDSHANSVPLVVPCTEHAVMRGVFAGSDDLPATMRSAIAPLLLTPVRTAASTQSDMLAHVQRAVDILTRQLLPRCILVRDGNTDSDAVGIASDLHGCCHVVCNGGEGRTSLHVLQSLVWNALVQAELADESSARELRTFLTSSEWARRTVQGAGNGQAARAQTYSSLFTPLVDACAVGMSVNPRVASTVADNVPLLDPHLAALFARCALLQSPATTCDKAREGLSARYALKRSRDVAEHAIMRRVRRTRDDIESTQATLAFDASAGSALRDVDQMTLMARDLLLSPLARQDTGGEAGALLMTARQARTLLFDRRRGAQGTAWSAEDAEGPALLPGDAGCRAGGAMPGMAGGGDEGRMPALTVLERFCMSAS